MKFTEETQQGFVAFLSGVITIAIMSAFTFIFSPSCTATKTISVPFVILFQILGSILSLLGMYIILKEYFKKKKHSKKRRIKKKR